MKNRFLSFTFYLNLWTFLSLAGSLWAGVKSFDLEAPSSRFFSLDFPQIKKVTYPQTETFEFNFFSGKPTFSAVFVYSTLIFFALRVFQNLFFVSFSSLKKSFLFISSGLSPPAFF